MRYANGIPFYKQIAFGNFQACAECYTHGTYKYSIHHHCATPAFSAPMQPTQGPKPTLTSKLNTGLKASGHVVSVAGHRRLCSAATWFQQSPNSFTTLSVLPHEYIFSQTGRTKGGSTTKVRGVSGQRDHTNATHRKCTTLQQIVSISTLYLSISKLLQNEVYMLHVLF